MVNKNTIRVEIPLATFKRAVENYTDGKGIGMYRYMTIDEAIGVLVDIGIDAEKQLHRRK